MSSRITSAVDGDMPCSISNSTIDETPRDSDTTIAQQISKTL